MDFEEASAALAKKARIERGRAIIQQKKGLQSVRPYRTDGYINVLNKYGTARDNGEAYEFVAEPIVPDTKLTVQYEDNGLFAKIIDTPAEEAVKHGIDLGLKDDALNDFVEKALDALEWEEKAATAIKWARLYGGSIIVMLIDDGRGLEEPVDWNNIRSIDELRVFERAVVQPDYASIYSSDPMRAVRNQASKFAMPEYYYVQSLYGSFTVHESRCLVFRNGILPERVTNPVYRFWGPPEFVRIKRAMKDAMVAHGNGPKLLDRSVQPIYKMKNLASLLAAEGGDEIVMKRLEIIDLARGILNSIAIDSDGEDWDFKSIPFSGVKDVIDTTCNMLSAVTNIPQTILFGRSPAGENSTGDSDFENYYNYIERIQKLMLKKNVRTLLDILFKAGRANGEIQEEPDYKLTFNPLWSLSDTEQANVDKVRADIELVKAQTAQAYVQMQAMDPSEVRAALARSEEFMVEDILDDQDEDWGLSDIGPDLSGVSGDLPPTLPEPPDTVTGLSTAQQPTSQATPNQDGAGQPTSAATLVVKDGKILIGVRRDREGICGPGGHIEDGETPEQAARREALEEFGIQLGPVYCLGQLDGLPEEYGLPVIFLCTDFAGEPVCDGAEMQEPAFCAMEELSHRGLFPPFNRSLRLLVDVLCGGDAP
ncbi:MAG: anti-CBASS protein Acb1 family protein [Oscillospiraceae bacterium]